MRFAIALDGEDVSQHFGHCDNFLIVTAQDGQPPEQKLLASPGHQPGLFPRFLAGHAVETVIAGGMGPRAQQLFQAQDIEVVTGISGSAEQVIQDFLAGELVTGENVCHH